MIQAALCRLIFLPFIIQKCSHCGFEILLTLGMKKVAISKGSKQKNCFSIGQYALGERSVWKNALENPCPFSLPDRGNQYISWF